MSSLRKEVEESLVTASGSGTKLTGRYRFPARLSVFGGHFPGRPIVPAVYLIETAHLLCERALGRPLRLEAIDQAKFTARVEPEAVIETEVTLSDEGGGWLCRARVESGGGQAARFRLRLASEQA
jgi:3-hydroxyacyl-[acyl-carrier-protein] dehydratase